MRSRCAMIYKLTGVARGRVNSPPAAGAYKAGVERRVNSRPKRYVTNVRHL